MVVVSRKGAKAQREEGKASHGDTEGRGKCASAKVWRPPSPAGIAGV